MTRDEAGAWPGDADTVAEWIRASLQPAQAGMVRGLDEVRITADVSGADLERLVIDATGVEMSLLPDPQPAEVPAPADPAVVGRRRGVIRTARVVAGPVRIESIPLELDLELHDAPVEWLVYAAPVDPARPETIRGLELAEDAGRMRGSFRASLRAADLAPLVTAIVRPLLEGTGVRLRRLSTTVAQDGPDGIVVEVATGVRWRLLAASARGTARLTVSAEGVITVRDLDVGSRNPLVAIALRAARRSVRAQVGRAFDLNEGLPPDGPRLHDVTVSAGDELTVSARLS